MQAEALVREGRLDEALAALQDAVRKDPASSRLRVFLFQLLCVNGAWERAMNQLRVAGEMDAGNLIMVQACGQAIQCEAFRADVFAGKRTPLVFGEPQAWVAPLVQACHLDAQGHHAQAADLRGRAFDEAPATEGSINGQPFAWLADADVRLGPVFEALIDGKYYWVPQTAVRRLKIEAPSDLRDVVWCPGEFTWINGGRSVAFLPVRYPGSERSPDAQIRMSRRTDFVEPAEGTVHALGQRVWATDAGETAMLATREIVLGAPMTPDEVHAGEGA